MNLSLVEIGNEVSIKYCTFIGQIYVWIEVQC